MRSLAADVRHGFRSLRGAPLVTVLTIATLALGLGATTAVLAVADAFLLRPLPYADPHDLLALRDGPAGGETPAAYPEYVAWREYLEPVAEVGAYWNVGYTLSGDAERPQMVAAQRISASTLRLLRLSPLFGRLFTDEDDLRTAPRVVLLAERFWRARFAADPAVVGRTILLDDIPHEVVGVLPAGFRGVLPTDASVNPRDLWIPLRLDTTVVPSTLHWLTVVGRVRSGVPREEAAERIAAAGDALRRDGRSEHALHAIPLVIHVGEPNRDLLQAIGAGVLLILLVTCANLGSLLLSRGAARTREVGIRLAIGAPRWRIAQQFLVESALLAAAGGALGLLVAWLALDWFRAAQPMSGVDVQMVRLNGRVVLMALGATVAAALIFGVAPARQALRVRVEGVLGIGRSDGGTRLGLRRAFIVAEVALAVTLLVGTGLLARSFTRLLAEERGFEPAGVLTFELDRPSNRPMAEHTQFFSELLERLAAMGDIQSAALVSALPLGGADVDGATPVDGLVLPDGERPSAQKRIVSPGYFETLGIPVLEGRSFTEADRAGARGVVVVSASFARRYLGGGSPLGRRVAFNWDIDGFQEVVGVVADVRHRGLHQAPLPMVYISYLQRPDSAFSVVLKTGTVEGTLLERVREEVAAMDPAQPVATFRSLDEIVGRTLAPRRVSLALMGGFAVLALGMVCLGVYGVISFSTRQRTREIGVRLALGATPAGVTRLILREGLTMSAFGLLVGLVLAYPAARLLESQLYATSASDPLTFGVAVLLLIGVSALATWLPATRAAGLDPTRALRAD